MALPLKNVHLATYGSNAFVKSARLLEEEARQFGLSHIHAYDPDSLPAAFLDKHRKFLTSAKGGGFWLWKPCIVRDALSRIQDGDFLFYADAGCSINSKGHGVFSDWLDACDAHGIISFQMHHLEKHYTKMSVAHAMNCTAPEYMDSGQIHASIFGIKKNDTTTQLVDEWLRICSLEWTIDDSVQNIKNDPSFQDHRHDQSVFSLLRKSEACHLIPDITYPDDGNWNNPSMQAIPIWVRRRRVT